MTQGKLQDELVKLYRAQQNGDFHFTFLSQPVPLAEQPVRSYSILIADYPRVKWEVHWTRRHLVSRMLFMEVPVRFVG